MIHLIIHDQLTVFSVSVKEIAKEIKVELTVSNASMAAMIFLLPGMASTDKHVNQVS